MVPNLKKKKSKKLQLSTCVRMSPTYQHHLYIISNHIIRHAEKLIENAVYTDFFQIMSISTYMYIVYSEILEMTILLFLI